MLTKLTVQCERGEGWWVAQGIEEPAIITQARRLDQVEGMVRDACELFSEFDHDHLEIVLQVDSEFSAQADKARTLRANAEKAHALATDECRKVAFQLREKGLGVRDIGVLLGVTYQYAQKLAVEGKRLAEAR